MSVRILVIEDNTANLELMIYLLQAFGYETLSAIDGEAGLELVRRTTPALIVCDIGLPKIDGYAIAARLKNNLALRNIPLVAVTALAMVGDRDKVLAAGFDGYIPKPIAPETFVKQIEQFLSPEQRAAPRESIATTPTAEPASQMQNHKTILAVDNVQANLDLAQSLFKPSGYHVLTATNVLDALALARQYHPDLIISDLHMPSGSGFDLILAMRADPELRNIMVVIHSATIMSKQDNKRALELGVDKFIARPLDSQALLLEIETLIKSGR